MSPTNQFVPLIWAMETIHFTLALTMLCFNVFRAHAYKTDQKSRSILFPITFFVIISSICRPLVFIISHGLFSSYLNNNSCNLALNLTILFYGLCKFGVHCFVAIRCRFSNTNKLTNTTTIWYKIGLCLILTDIGLLILPFTAYGTIIQGVYRNHLCQFNNVHTIFIAWTGISDFVIAGYALIAFIRPLKKIINLEKQLSKLSDQSSSNLSFQILARRIIWYSCIALISTMFTVFIVITLDVRNAPIQIISLTGPIDMTINCFCVLSQFKHISLPDDAPLIFRVFWGVCQCEYNNIIVVGGNESIALRNIGMLDVPSNTANNNSKSNNNNSKEDESQSKPGVAV